MNRICVSALALVALAGAANAQSVEFRFRERTGQTIANSGDALLEMAVQARVTGGNLGGFNFNILTDDAEANGSLSRARISNADHSYFTGTPWAANSGVATGGVASTFSYLAGINANFNGLINLTGGTFVDNPGVNEIGLVAGAATGAAMLNTPNMDPNGEGSPATFANYGQDPVVGPVNNDVAAMDPSLAGPYFGNGQFIDLFRFRYTVTNFSARVVHFSLGDLGAQFFSQFLYNNGAWGAQNATAAANAISSLGYDVTITPTPASVALMGLGGLMVARRRRA